MTTCSSCGAEIIWAVSEAGKNIPMDAEPVVGALTGLFVLERAGSLRRAVAASKHPSVPALFVSHFATCPDAAEHRRS